MKLLLDTIPKNIGKLLFKPSIILYLDSYKRDLKPIRELASKLKKKNFNIFIASRRNFLIASLILRPKDIYLIGQIDMAYKISKYIKANIYLSPAECCISNKVNEFFYPNDYKYYKNLKYIFVWGSRTKQWLNQFRSKQLVNTKISELGFLKSKYLRTINRRKNNQTPKNKIGLVGRFSNLNDLWSRLPSKDYFEEDNYHVYGRLSVETELLEFYRNFTKSNNPTNYKISLRPHPTEQQYTFSKYFDDISSSEGICEWLDSLDCLIGPGSTVIYEAHLAGIPYFCTDTILNTKEKTIYVEPILEKSYNYCYHPETLDELLEQVNSHETLQLRSSLSLEDVIECNEKAIDELSNIFMNEFNNKYDYLFIIKNILLLSIDTAYIIYHHLFNKKRLLFDYSYLHHSKVEL